RVRAQTKRFSVDLLQIDGDGLAVISTDLDGQGIVLGQNFNAVELSLFRYAVNLTQTLGDFCLDGLQIGFRVGTVGGLNRQFPDALKVVVDFVQRTFGRLSDGDTIVSVTGSLGQTLDVGRE